MPYRRRSRGAGFARAPQRRKRVWAQTDVDLGPLGAGLDLGTDLLADFRAKGGSTEGVTVARSHVAIQWSLGAAGALQLDRQQFGLIVRGRVAGLPAGFNPSADPYEDWALAVSVPQYGYNQPWIVANNACSYVTDLRAMRRCEELQDSWFLSVRNLAAVSCSYHVFARVLLMLP